MHDHVLQERSGGTVETRRAAHGLSEHLRKGVSPQPSPEPTGDARAAMIRSMETQVGRKGVRSSCGPHGMSHIPLPCELRVVQNSVRTSYLELCTWYLVCGMLKRHHTSSGCTNLFPTILLSYIQGMALLHNAGASEAQLTHSTTEDFTLLPVELSLKTPQYQSQPPPRGCGVCCRGRAFRGKACYGMWTR